MFLVDCDRIGLRISRWLRFICASWELALPLCVVVPSHNSTHYSCEFSLQIINQSVAHLYVLLPSIPQCLISPQDHSLLRHPSLLPLDKHPTRPNPLRTRPIRRLHNAQRVFRRRRTPLLLVPTAATRTPHTHHQRPRLGAPRRSGIQAVQSVQEGRQSGEIRVQSHDTPPLLYPPRIFPLDQRDGHLVAFLVYQSWCRRVWWSGCVEGPHNCQLDIRCAVGRGGVVRAKRSGIYREVAGEANDDGCFHRSQRPLLSGLDSDVCIGRLPRVVLSVDLLCRIECRRVLCVGGQSWGRSGLLDAVWEELGRL